jgi:hypothetical protein
MKRNVWVVNCLLAVFLAACQSATPTPLPSTATPLPPTATPLPPTATSTPIPPSPTPKATIVIVKVSAEVMQELSTWDEGIAFYTSATDPITDLSGLSENQIAMWGGELFPNYTQLFGVVGEPKATGKVIGDVANIFTKNPDLRLFITWDSFEEDIVDTGGGIRIRFEQK